MNSRNRYTNPLLPPSGEFPEVLRPQPTESDEEYTAFVDHCASWFDVGKLLAPCPNPVDTEDLEKVIGPLPENLRSLSKQYNWPQRFIAWREWLLPSLKQNWRFFAEKYGLQLLFSRTRNRPANSPASLN